MSPGQAFRCRANKPETSINPLGCSAAAPPPMPILHEPVDTILSQSPGLWESMPQLIGFAGRLGFGAAHGWEKAGGGLAGGWLVVAGMQCRTESIVLCFPHSLSLSLVSCVCVCMRMYVFMYVCMCVCVCVALPSSLFLAAASPTREPPSVFHRPPAVHGVSDCLSAYPASLRTISSCV